MRIDLESVGLEFESPVGYHFRSEIMHCRWCNGTGDECGCGHGYCAHCCGEGAVADSPFNMPQHLQMLHPRNVNEFAERFGSTSLPAFIQQVAEYASGESLSQQDTDVFVQYWGNPKRDCTLGEFINEIAYRALNK